MMLRWMTSGLCLTLLTACSVGPDYVRPAMELPAGFKAAGGWKVAAPAEVDNAAWWTAFGDPQLNALQDRLAIDNQTVAQSVAKLKAARALYDQADAARYPTLGVTASSSRGKSAGAGTADTATLSAAASWEPDLWGKLSRGVEAGAAEVAASEADLAAVRLSARAQLATSYLQWQVSRRQQASLEASIAAWQEQRGIVQHRIEAGVASRADLLQADSQLNTLKAQRAATLLQAEQYEHAIAVLAGQAPANLVLTLPAALPEPLAIPARVPGALLERRPDIAAAERRVAEANARIGLARAAFFPDLTLSASGGWKASRSAEWFTAPARAWSLGPALALTLLDGGARRAAERSAEAGYEQNAALYRQTVLTALQDVEDALSASTQLEAATRYDTEAWQSAREAEAITVSQYQAGTVPWLSVLVARTTTETAARSYYGMQAQRLAANISLIRALGGGWQRDTGKPPASGASLPQAQ